MAFRHENLEVYKRTLAFNAKVCDWVAQWDGSRHAIGDHLDRAATSMVEGIAVACSAYSAMKIRYLDYAIGSTLECAACLDLAGLKRLLDAASVQREKKDLSGILHMLIGLRRSWSNAAQLAREEEAEYGNKHECLFNHETLDVYRTAIAIATLFASSDAETCLPKPVFRRLDELQTSIVLNIAEGNGRFSAADHCKFLAISREAAVKMAARLDLHLIQGLFVPDAVATYKSLLERVSAMLAVMMGAGKGKPDSTKFPTRFPTK